MLLTISPLSLWNPSLKAKSLTEVSSSAVGAQNLSYPGLWQHNGCVIKSLPRLEVQGPSPSKAGN